MRRKRHLTEDELALWDLVARRAKPLDPATKSRQRVDPAAKPTPHRPEPKAHDMHPPPLKPFRVGQAADHTGRTDIVAPIAERLTKAPLQMDAKVHGRMTRGKLTPEARIDLHGMTLAEAHPELVAFILGSQAVGRRLVLVITGKGKDRDDGGPIPVRFGLLRHQVPQWLNLPPLRQAVLQVTPAHLRHGGHGAYYVYLRRQA